MATVVTLDNVEHHDLKVLADRGAAFGDNINQAIVFPNEFRDLQREYPILFRKDKDGTFQSVVLLGFDRDENLFLKDKVWDARYMPAVQARGPFMIGVHRSEDGEQAEPDVKVHVDLENPAVNKENGYALFLPHGGQSPYLNHIINVLRTLHDGLSISKAFFSLLDELDLIEPLTLEVKIDETRQYTVPQVYSISEEKFRSLSPQELGRLHETGMLSYCFWVLGSLDNIRPLVDRKIRA